MMEIENHKNDGEIGNNEGENDQEIESDKEEIENGDERGNNKEREHGEIEKDLNRGAVHDFAKPYLMTLPFLVQWNHMPSSHKTSLPCMADCSNNA